MALSQGFADLAAALQEAFELSHDDIRTTLQSCIQEQVGSDRYAYIVDIFGDQAAGHVVYSCAGELRKAPYTITGTEGARACTIDTKTSIEVLPRTVYDTEGDETNADEALHNKSTSVEITGDAVPLREGAVGQDGTAYLKLIAPGWGSSGYYSEAVLKRDGPKVFPNGTKNFWNHQTAEEETARPEGDLRDLASVLTEDAAYRADGPAGPGLYAKAKVFEGFRQPVDDLAKHIGMSIRASGVAKEGTAEGRTGKIIEKITRGVSVDYVTTPGAGGKILQLFEAARRPIPNPGETEMDEATVLRLIESKTAPLLAENRLLRERMTLIGAPAVINGLLRTIALPDASKARIVRTITPAVPFTEAGTIDEVKLKALVEAAAVEEAQFLESLHPGIGKVSGMGSGAAAGTAAAPVEPDAAAVLAEAEGIFGELLGDSSAGKRAAAGRAA